MKPRLLLLFFLVLLLPACDQPGSNNATSYPTPAPTGTVRIVSSFPRRGVDAHQSKLITQAIDLAIEQAGIITGTTQVEHIALDGGSGESGDPTAEQERSNASLAANDPSVVAYIGPYTSGATGDSLPITNKAGLLQLGPTATWPGLTLEGWNASEPGIYYPTGKRNYVRLMPPDSAQAIATAQWASRLGAKSAFIVEDGSTYSDGLAEQFKASSTSLGLRTAGSSAPGDDATKLAEAIEASGADAVFYAPSTVGQAVKLAKALNGLKLKYGVFVSDTALSDQFIDAVGADAEDWHFLANEGASYDTCGATTADLNPGLVLCGACTPTPQDASGFAQPSQPEAFRSEFEKKYGEEMTPFAQNAYALTKLVLGAISGGAGRDRSRVMERVMNEKAVGACANDAATFDSNGDISPWTIDAYRLRNGHFVAEQPISSR